MRHHVFLRYTVINISKRDFSVFIIARVRPLFANPVTIYGYIFNLVSINWSILSTAITMYFTVRHVVD